ncbi:chromosomal replication initiator DnaA [Ruegeria pomeroyi]|nr:chromosomal replication initiator DnaA [Ruegeria pomeroyi]MCE8530474.1 chromosomal replication initiator DnaA [Ruegeria pomeroyi]
MARQLSFDLPAMTALGREDFFVSPANALAVAMISAQVWPGGKLVLTGPAGAGKTHLAHVWAAETGGRITAAADLAEADIPQLASGPVAVEDVPLLAGDDARQALLFHLHNLTLANGNPLLLTGQQAPGFWGLALPDLQSRIEGAQHVALDPPDDALLGAVLAKLFVDRQLSPGPEVISYLVKHMDRSFEAAARMVEALDRIALAEKRDITRALAVRLLNDQPGAAGHRN